MNARKAAKVGEVIVDPRMVECDQCGRKLRDKYSLKKHVRIGAFVEYF